MEVLLFLLLSLAAGALHGVVLRFTLPEEARSRSLAAGLLAGPFLVVLGALPFVLPLLIGLILAVAGFYALMRYMHDQTWLSASLVLLGDLVLIGAAAFAIIDAYLLATGMDTVKQLW